MLRKTFLDLKTVWKALLLMVLLEFILYPLYRYNKDLGVGNAILIGSVLQQIQLISPVACALPVGLMLRFQLEEGCCEPIHALVAVYRLGPGSLLLTEAILLMGYTLPVFLVFMPTFGSFYWQEWLRTMAQGFFLQNLIVATGYLTHLSLAGLGVLVLFVGAMQSSMTSLRANSSLMNLLNIYSPVSGNIPRPWQPGRVAITALCGFILWAVAALRMKNFLDRSII